jgi:2-polyprenyl-3-methyl-5-hydroxy-6-metoxy-1,4-benzoquinol methylase
MDFHRAGHYMSAAHCPDIAWPAWRDGKHQQADCLPFDEDVIAAQDTSHLWSTSEIHLRQLFNLALGRRHFLEVGTVRGAASWTMAAAGALVTTLDPAHEKSARLFRHGLSIDAMAHTGEQWLAMDPDGRYDLIFHDAEHGPHIIPELRAWWQRLTPGGALAIHDAEQLDGWRGEELTPHATTTTDERGRELLVLTTS